MIKEMDLKPRYIGGASFVRHKPIFSNDAQFIIVASTKCLYSYTTKTGKRFLEYKGLNEEIVGYDIYNQDNTEYLIACTVNGNIMCWKISNGLKLKQGNIGQENIKFFKLYEQAPGEYQALVAWRHEKFLNCGTVNILQSFKLQSLKINLKYYKKCSYDIGGQFDKTFFCAPFGKKVVITNLKNTEKTVKLKIKPRKFTCVTCHPEREAVLTGDNTGRIILWQNLYGTPTQAVYHWHTLPVKTLCFSNSGTTFYSGADECVLVKWVEENSNQKKFLPRLPNCIQHLAIAPENLYLAVATKDNAIHVIDMQFNTVSIIQELIFGDNFLVGLHLDPKTRALVLNGTVGYLQFFSTQTRQLLYNLDVVGMNRITNERNTVMFNTEVRAVALSKSGLWMATIEERTDNWKFEESRLKFWNYNLTNQSFQLNTNVEYAHEARIINLKFQPTNKEDNLRLVTIGKDGFFKVWQLVDATTVYTKGFSWRCASSGFYRDLKPTCLAFSHDSSLLAVAFENILTTWLPDTIQLKCTLLHPNYQDAIKQIAFGTNMQCHLIVAVSNEGLSVWNLLTLSMIWTVPLHVSHLITDSLSTHMAVITTNNKLFVFEPISEKPIYTQDDVVSDDKSVLAAVFVPNTAVKRNYGSWYSKTQLYIVDSNKELYCLDSSGARDDALETMQFMLDETQASTFSLMTPAHKATTQQSQNAVIHNFTQRTACKKLDDLLDSPIHTMVPMRMVAHAIISSMIYEKKEVSHSDDDELKMEIVVENNSEELNQVATIDEVTEDLSKIALEPINWVSIMADNVESTN